MSLAPITFVDARDCVQALALVTERSTLRLHRSRSVENEQLLNAREERDKACLPLVH